MKELVIEGDQRFRLQNLKQLPRSVENLILRTQSDDYGGLKDINPSVRTLGINCANPMGSLGLPRRSNNPLFYSGRMDSMVENILKSIPRSVRELQLEWPRAVDDSPKRVSNLPAGIERLKIYHSEPGVLIDDPPPGLRSVVLEERLGYFQFERSRLPSVPIIFRSEDPIGIRDLPSLHLPAQVRFEIGDGTNTGARLSDYRLLQLTSGAFEWQEVDGPFQWRDLHPPPTRVIYKGQPSHLAKFISNMPASVTAIVLGGPEPFNYWTSWETPAALPQTVNELTVIYGPVEVDLRFLDNLPSTIKTLRIAGPLTPASLGKMPTRVTSMRFLHLDYTKPDMLSRFTNLTELSISFPAYQKFDLSPLTKLKRLRKLSILPWGPSNGTSSLKGLPPSVHDLAIGRGTSLQFY